MFFYSFTYIFTHTAGRAPGSWGAQWFWHTAGTWDQTPDPLIERPPMTLSYYHIKFSSISVRLSQSRLKSPYLISVDAHPNIQICPMIHELFANRYSCDWLRRPSLIASNWRPGSPPPGGCRKAAAASKVSLKSRLEPQLSSAQLHEKHLL